MTHITLQNPAAPKDAGIIKFTMFLGGVVFLLMMVFGLIMRAAQGGLIDLDPTLFYQLLTAHGAGMVGSAALSGAAILWYFASRHINLRTAIYTLFLGLFLLGVVLIFGINIYRRIWWGLDVSISFACRIWRRMGGRGRCGVHSRLSCYWCWFFTVLP